jgi:hypothetical protein
MRRRMRDDIDALRSSASAMLWELRMQEERDGDDDYYHDRRCAPDDASHLSPPPSLSSLAPHLHRECNVVGVADGGAEFGPVRNRASMTVASVRGQTQQQEHRQQERQQGGVEKVTMRSKVIRWCLSF